LQSQRVRPGKDKAPDRSPMMEGGMQLLNRDGHSVSHNSKRHYHDSFVSMNRMRQRGLLCDIVLHVGTKEIKAHKVVLASCSPYFHAMFTSHLVWCLSLLPPSPLHLNLEQCWGEMSESRQTHVTLHDIDPQALEQLTLLPAASLLQLNGVRDACCKFLLSQLDPSNCLGIRGFADTHSCSDLLKSAHKYVLQHFVEVSKTEEFMLLPLKQAASVLEPYATEMFMKRYDGTSDLATVESYDPVTNSWQPEVSMGTRRSCLGVAVLHGLLYAAGGYDGASCLNSAERYDPLTGTWTSIAAMSTRRRYVRVATLDGNLYAVGGYDSSSHLATVEKYDPQTNTWTSVANMISRRSSAGVAVLEGMLYVAGGNDGTSCLNSVERFNYKANTWESVAPMNIRRSTHDLVAMDGWLYAVGGNDGSSSLNSIEKYNPRTNKWMAASCMFTRRSSVGVAVLELLNFPPPSSPTLSVSSTSL
ncbi:KLH17 protein, partial [Atractosteus spatula]|nr:KLH17 protein [Atractosteus spatula]